MTLIILNLQINLWGESGVGREVVCMCWRGMCVGGGGGVEG